MFAFTYLVYVLIVVSVGGLGSIAGSFAAAACSASATSPANIMCPQLGAFLIYLVMVGAADVAAGRPVREALK